MNLSPLKWILGLPAPWLRWFAGPPVVVDGDPLDLQLHALIRLASLGGPRKPQDGEAATARALMRASVRLLGDASIRLASVEDRVIPGPGGALPVRVYTPSGGAAQKPLLVFFHGGGWVLGDLDTHDTLVRRLARDLDVVAVAVHYRLAPEAVFPAAADDALAAFRWAAAHAAELGGDPSRLVVAGDSAGGNLATVVALELVRAGERAPDLQVLIYPVTDLVQESASYGLFATGFQLDRVLMQWFRGHYLPDDAAARDPRASPLHADSLAGMPPAVVLTAGFDVLRDEGIAYVRRLALAGVDVEHHHHGALIHGFFSMAGVCREADRAVDQAVEAVKRRLGADG